MTEEQIYTLNCERCNQAFYSTVAFPAIPLCSDCQQRQQVREAIAKSLKADRILSLTYPNWISVKDKLPIGQWSISHPHLSEEVLIANSCSINIGFYNREDGTWYVDEPAKKEWIDKITHWMPLPPNPHSIGGER